MIDRKKFPGRYTPHFMSVVIFIIISGLTVFTVFSEYERKLQEQRMDVLNRLSLIRAHMEGELSSRLLLAKGLVSYITNNPDISREEFLSYSGVLVGKDPLIKNITILKNTTIIFAYPIEGNEKAIGIDLAKIPSQRETLFQAIHTKKNIIAGPVDLVQGGKGIISRIPIFIPPGRTIGKEQIYWGQASIVISQDRLFEAAGITNPSLGLSLALRGVDGKGAGGKLFWGKKEIFSDNPVSVEISLPAGSWEMAAVPAEGWGVDSVYVLVLFLFGMLLAVFFSILVYSLLTTRESLREMAFHDYLTGLPNRAVLEDRISVALAWGERNKSLVGIFILDLDNFKDVNDTYGHHVGDLLLQGVAQRLMEQLRTCDTIVRLGGDEFAIVVSGIQHKNNIHVIEEKIRSLFKEPFSCGGVSLQSRVSIGYSVFPLDGSDRETLLIKADTRMYSNKSRGVPAGIH
ncbi:MAG TPA: diguanylate cyclase [Spirochaetota bacterium]|nr:diguanylate cyclase [Spirochaetota bacterium]